LYPILPITLKVQAKNSLQIQSLDARDLVQPIFAITNPKNVSDIDVAILIAGEIIFDKGGSI
jgi:hypothetical protein